MFILSTSFRVIDDGWCDFGYGYGQRQVSFFMQVEGIYIVSHTILHPRSMDVDFPLCRKFSMYIGYSYVSHLWRKERRVARSSKCDFIALK